MYKPRNTSASPRVVILAMICMCLSSTTFAAPPVSVRIYVDLSATGNHTGTTWTDAYTDLHDALTEAATIASPIAPVEIWVAGGLYYPDHGVGDRLGMYRVPAYTELYGGFAGTEVVRTQRDWHAHPTILDGDLLGNDDLSFVPTSNCCTPHLEPGCDNPACEAIVVALDTRCDDPPHPEANAWSDLCASYAKQQCCQLCRPSRCDNTRRIFNVTDGSGVIIDGFSMLNGEYDFFGHGAAVHVHSGKLEIRNCSFLANVAASSGAVFVASAASILLEHSLFERNDTYRSGDGIVGIASNASDSAVRDCVFRNNITGIVGSSNYEVRRCLFEHNRYSVVSAYFGSTLVADSWFVANDADISTVVRISGATSTIVNCMFLNNTGAGCPTMINSGVARVVDCAFIGNISTGDAAIACLGGPFASSVVANSLFAFNRTQSGGALSASPLLLYNSIFWGNRDQDPNTSLQEEQIDKPSPPIVVSQQIDHNIVEGWDGSLGGVGNSGVDPLFVDPLGPDMLPATGDGNYRLSFDSPAIDAGHPSPPLLAVRDLDGHRRTLCGATDLGPYEFGIADSDCDGDTDLADYFGLPACLTGPTPVALPASCYSFDFDADDAVDLSDVAGFANSFTAP